MSEPRTELDALLERIADAKDWNLCLRVPKVELMHSVAMDCLRMLPDVARELAEARGALECTKAAHARCIEALRELQEAARCPCKVKERESGHRVDCWTRKIAGDVLVDPSVLATEEWLRARDARVWEEGAKATASFIHAIHSAESLEELKHLVREFKPNPYALEAK